MARILAGVDEGKISKEKAAEMIAALNKGIEQGDQNEDPILNRMLDGYWKADPAIRGGYATRIEMYLQSKASRERGGQEKRPAQSEARGLTDENIWKLIEGGIRAKTAVENGEVTKDKAVELFRDYMKILGIVGGGNGQPSKAGDDEAIARIRAAVAAGEMTKEEGRAKLGAYRKSLGQKAREENQKAEAGEKTREEAGESKLVE